MHTFTPASSKSNSSVGVAAVGRGHAVAASSLPLLPRPLSFHPSSNPTSLLFLSLPSTAPLCQASLEALGILQGTEETRVLLFRGLYLLGRESP